MRKGKLNNQELKENVLNIIGRRRDEVKVSSSLSLDCASFNLGEYDALITTDPITGATENIGSIAIKINSNDIVSCGGEAVLALLCIIATPETPLAEIKSIMRDAEEEAKKQNIEIIGGHTEFSDAVNRTIINCVMVGKSKKPFFADKAKIGDDIVMTKYAALEATAIIASDKEHLLKGILSEEEIRYAKGLTSQLSVVDEANLASKYEISAMHDITEGGVFGAVAEMVEASGAGALIEVNKIPVLNVTKKIANALNIDPYRLISSGSLIITTSNGKRIVKKLEEAGIKATIIGKIVKDEKTKAIFDNREEIITVKSDELFKLEV